MCIACVVTPLLEVAALLELVDDAEPDPAVAPVVYLVPFAPIVGSGTLPLSSHDPLVKGGHVGGLVVAV